MARRLVCVAVGIMGNRAKPHYIKAVQTGAHGLEIAFRQDKGIDILFLLELLKEIGRKERINALPLWEAVLWSILILYILRRNTRNKVVFEARDTTLVERLAHVRVGVAYDPAMQSINENTDVAFLILREDIKRTAAVAEICACFIAQFYAILFRR